MTDTAQAIKDEAPHLAALLTLAPQNGTPLLAVAFGFFFRREVESNEELAHGLTFDFLRQLSERQERGFLELEVSLGGHIGPVLDRLDGLFDALGEWFAGLGQNVREIHARLDQYDATMQRLHAFLERNDVPTNPSKPTGVSVASEEELQRLRVIRDVLRSFPPGLLSAADWTQLGQALRASGCFPEADSSDEAAARSATFAANRAAEALAEFHRYKDACETSDWAKAASALRRAVELDRAEYQPFDWLRYELVAVLGAGGFGTVFHCRDRFDLDADTNVPIPVAIKTLHDDGLDRTVDVVFREARTLKKLDHPSIIAIRDQDYAQKVDETTRRRPYFVLEFFPGPTLEAYLKQHRTIPAADLVRLAHRIAEAVHAAHSAGVLHRDLKPANILVAHTPQNDWDIRVIDFGLAVKLGAAARASVNIPSDRRSSQDRSFAGTLRYAAPEQMGNLPGVSPGPYSDVFAFGRTCIECLFGTTNPQEGHWRKLPEPVRQPLRLLLGRCVTDDLDALDDDLPGRFTTFEPVIAELSGLIGQPAQSRPKVNPPKVVPPTVTVEEPEIPFAEPVEEEEVRQETPLQFFKRVKAEIVVLGQKARAFEGCHDYVAAVQVLANLSADQARVWAENSLPEKELLRDLTVKRDRLNELRKGIDPLYRNHKFHDPRLRVWVEQYLKLKPDDREMRELLDELPPPNEPPAQPKAGDVYSLRIVTPESEHKPGAILTVKIPSPDRGPKPGTPAAIQTVKIPAPDRGPKPGTPDSVRSLKWKPVPTRPNPHK